MDRRLSGIVPAPGVMLPHLRAWRLDHGLSVAELAARAFCTGAYIRMLENGQRGASRRFIPVLALALDIDPARLQHEAPRSTAAAHPRGAARTSRRSGTAA